MSKVYRGWVSVPVLMLVIVFGMLMVRYQTSLQSNELWKTQQKLSREHTIWHESYELLSFMSASMSLCSDFCSPEGGHWTKNNTSMGQVWLQKQRISHLAVERWCVTRDQQRIRCWWIHDDGRYSTSVLNH